MWLTADGRRIPFTEMETSHLRNSIARIRRSKMKWRPAALPLLIAELERRGAKDNNDLTPARITNRFRNLDFD